MRHSPCSSTYLTINLYAWRRAGKRRMTYNVGQRETEAVAETLLQKAHRRHFRQTQYGFLSTLTNVKFTSRIMCNRKCLSKSQHIPLQKKNRPSSQIS